jgi:hypothetical protein
MLLPISPFGNVDRQVIVPRRLMPSPLVDALEQSGEPHKREGKASLGPPTGLVRPADESDVCDVGIITMNRSPDVLVMR